MIDLHKLDKFRLKDREREFYGCTGDSGKKAVTALFKLHTAERNAANG